MDNWWPSERLGKELPSGRRTTAIYGLWQARRSKLAHDFPVKPIWAELTIAGIVSAAIMGFVGGFFPALRAARMPVATALREL